ncbi:hypothetical protein [Burkholderia multivorans]|uniref:hypothetical protein n=1 Tax=Burkholderiaceae TaxID=119060 RepID=UPI00057DDE14|nr:hypothetical protein [Burkholderia multivorans]KHS13960.1 hypothetical protein BMD20_12515 [Burkholderia multivorans]MDR9229603.1 hypothetical protein [Burkholderia multivorans]HDR9473283.1 hypothetical protein [Burkholderia multivorans]
MKKQKNVSIHWINMTVMVDGVEVAGSYSVDETDWMTVRMIGGGSKSTHGGPVAASVARLMLCELYAETNRTKN